MKLIERQYPPTIAIMDVMRITGIWPDFLTMTTFEQMMLGGRVFEMELDGKVAGFFVLHSLVPGVQVQEDLMILPRAQGRWATRGALQAIRDTATRVAFDELGVERIVGYVDENNTRSRRLTEKLGMTCEGRARHLNRIGGEWRNMMIYSLLRDEA